MYDIKSLNIWKASSRKDILKGFNKVLSIDVSIRKEICMDSLMNDVCKEIMLLVPNMDFMEIKKRKNGRFLFPIYINEKLESTDIEALELTVRSSNSLHRAGYKTIADVVNAIVSSEDLKKIRNCGAKSITEIMEKIFCYQYRQLDENSKIRYINKLVDLNRY